MNVPVTSAIFTWSVIRTGGNLGNTGNSEFYQPQAAISPPGWYDKATKGPAGKELPYPGGPGRKAERQRQDRLKIGDRAFPQLRILLQQRKLSLTKHFAENHI